MTESRHHLSSSLIGRCLTAHQRKRHVSLWIIAGCRSGNAEELSPRSTSNQSDFQGARFHSMCHSVSHLLTYLNHHDYHSLENNAWRKKQNEHEEEKSEKTPTKQADNESIIGVSCLSPVISWLTPVWAAPRHLATHVTLWPLLPRFIHYNLVFLCAVHSSARRSVWFSVNLCLLFSLSPSFSHHQHHCQSPPASVPRCSHCCHSP